MCACAASERLPRLQCPAFGAWAPGRLKEPHIVCTHRGQKSRIRIPPKSVQQKVPKTSSIRNFSKIPIWCRKPMAFTSHVYAEMVTKSGLVPALPALGEESTSRISGVASWFFARGRRCVMCPVLGWPRSTVEKGPQSNESYERENPWNRTISTVLWVHKKLTVKLVLPSNESYESKKGWNRTLATVLWVPQKSAWEVADYYLVACVRIGVMQLQLPVSSGVYDLLRIAGGTEFVGKAHFSRGLIFERKPPKKNQFSTRNDRRRTNVQQLTCKIDLSNSFYYLFFSFVLIELKPFVLKGKVLGEKFWKVLESAKKCEKLWNDFAL